MSELVPDTPKPTAEAQEHAKDLPPTQVGLDSFGASYLYDALNGAGGRNGSQQTLPAAPRQVAPAADDSRDDDGDLTSIANSQLPPADDTSTRYDAQMHNGGAVYRTRSALVLGPDDHSGYSDPLDDLANLPETQAAHSLDEDSWRRSRTGGRTSTGSAGSMRGAAGAGVDADRTENELEDVSMDLTKAVGRVLSDHGDETVDGQPSASAATAPRPAESQKENPTPSFPFERPPSNAPFSLHNSHSILDDTSGAPSSSPAVARELLQRRSPKKVQALEEPASSADPDLSPSVLLSPQRPAARQAQLRSIDGAQESRTSSSMSGPETSTPAFANIPPPAPPVTAARTLPTLAVAHPALREVAPLSRAGTLPAARRTASTVKPDLFASAAAMKAPLPPKKKITREAWDGISQDTESVRSSESMGQSAPAGRSIEDEELPQTVLHDETMERTQMTEGAAAAGSAMGEQSVAEMEVDEETPLEATVRHEETLGAESAGSSLAAPAAGPASTTGTNESSLEPFPRRDPAVAPLFNLPSATASSESSSPGSRSPVKADFADAKGKKRLSDISELKSSMEAPSQVFEVEPTQAEYDALVPASLKTQDVQIDNSDHWHASFQHDTSTDSATARARQESGPAPGRELRRRPPPPSPSSAPKPASTSSSTSALPADAYDVPVGADDLGADLSTLPQATQHAPPPESSPEVPLARTRPAPVARGEFGSSGGHIVPDSDEPSQEDRGAMPPPALFAGAAKSRKAEKGKARAEEPATEVQAQESYKDSAGGFDEDEQMRDAEADQAEERPAPKRTVKGKGKAQRSTEASKLAAKEVKPVVQKAGPAVKRKSRASTSRVEDDHDSEEQEDESPDALNYLEETNYSVLPTAKNIKNRPARKAAPPPTVKKDKGKRRASETPSVDGHDDGDDAPVARKRRRSAMCPVVEIPVLRRSSATPLSNVSKKTTPARKAKPAAQVRGKKRASTRSAPTASPEPPVAGPSRSRLRSIDRSGSARTVSPALIDVKPVLKSRLPSTAPFTRVLAFWRDDDTGYYSGTVTGFVGGKFEVRFDDGSKGKILPGEIRRCELVVGDRLTYVGDENYSETQRESLESYVIVTAIERGEVEGGAAYDEEEDVKEGEGLAANDVVVVDAGGRSFRLQVSAIRISQRDARQLEDRRLTDDELALFEGKEPAKTPLQRLAILPPPEPLTVKQLRKVDAADRDRMFGRTAFVVTSRPVSSSSRRHAKAGLSKEDPDTFVARLEEHGATIIDWANLFTVNQKPQDDASPELFFPHVDFEHIEDIFLLADCPSATSKYLVALALGVPCLAKKYATDAMATSTLVDWHNYVLSAGFIHEFGAQGMGAQLRAVQKTACGLDTLEGAYKKGGVFSDKAFVVVMRKDGRSKADKAELAKRSYIVLALLSCASARIVHFVASLEDARSAGGYDYVFFEDDGAKALPTALARHKGLVNMVWLKQCVIAGRLLPAVRMKEMDEA